jgi:hypothetical protein
MEVIVYDMPYDHKSDNIYYLLFATRKESAKKIMRDIFSNEKSVGYRGQLTLGFKNSFEV